MVQFLTNDGDFAPIDKEPSKIESALSAITPTKDVKKYKKMILRTRTIIREKKLAAFKNGEINESILNDFRYNFPVLIIGNLLFITWI